MPQHYNGKTSFTFDAMQALGFEDVMKRFKMNKLTHQSILQVC